MHIFPGVRSMGKLTFGIVWFVRADLWLSDLHDAGDARNQDARHYGGGGAAQYEEN